MTIEKLKESVFHKSKFVGLVDGSSYVNDSIYGEVGFALTKVEGINKENMEVLILLSRDSKEKELLKANHLIRYYSLAKFNMFIVPVIYPKADGIYYEAVISRMVGF